ncbi:MAG TPA: type II toxin-antitoxin system VapC family toxin [Allosphingosinicella sp.]|nr:type II toxin-antitoxin system VapC family toxin [Allosphingosinicella sp.]
MIVIDTHVLIWAVQDDPKLSAGARALLDTSDGLMVSAITAWEMALLAKKKRLELGMDAAGWIEETLSLPAIVLAPIGSAIAIDSVMLPGTFHDDPADRIIIATARHHHLPLLTVDEAILDYAATGHVGVIDARL